MIVVTGLPRSGTSLMMRLLETGGVECFYDDGYQPASDANPHGFYEHPDVMAARWEAVSIPAGVAVKVMTGLFYLDDLSDVEQVIVCRRPIPNVLASINKRRDLIDRAHETEDYCQGQIDALRLKVSARPHIEVWFDDMIRSTPNECLRIARFLDRVPGECEGKPLDLAAMAACVDPALRHHGG